MRTVLGSWIQFLRVCLGEGRGKGRFPQHTKQFSGTSSGRELNPIQTLLVGSVRSHRLRLQSDKTRHPRPFRRQRQSHSRAVCFWPKSCKSEDHTTSLGSIHLLGRLTELRNVLLTGALLYYQTVSVSNSQMERWFSKAWERVQGFHTVSRRATVPPYPRVHLPGRSPTHCLWVLYGGSITQAGLTNSLAIGERFCLLPLSPPWPSGGWGRKFQPSNHRLGALGDQPPSLGDLGAFPKWPC